MGIYRLPVSVKGVLLDAADRVCLLKKDRNEWELPGGRLEPRESPEQALVREAGEELGIQVLVGSLLDAQVAEVIPGREVFLVTYRCFWDGEGQIRKSSEHEDVGWFSAEVLCSLKISACYTRAIKRSLDD